MTATALHTSIKSRQLMLEEMLKLAVLSEDQTNCSGSLCFCSGASKPNFTQGSWIIDRLPKTTTFIQNNNWGATAAPYRKY